MPIPEWAVVLMLEVIENEGVNMPTMKWRRASRLAGSSGHCKYGIGIVVTAGADKDREEQKMVLLHELAHWLTPKQNHNDTFYTKAWDLYHRHNVSIQYALEREGAYKKQAIKTYHRIYG